MVTRKQLSIALSQNYKDFQSPQIEYEQYGTPVDIATGLLFRAFNLGDIEGCNVVDLCSGPGILGIGAVLMGAESCTFVEVEKGALEILRENIARFDIRENCTILEGDTLDVKGHFETCLMNPPFGIQQRRGDMLFLRKALEISDVVYSIHDGSEKNREYIPEFIKKMGYKPLEYYIESLTLKRSYTFHKKAVKQHSVMILRSMKNV